MHSTLKALLLKKEFVVKRAYFQTYRMALIFIKGCHERNVYAGLCPVKGGFRVTWKEKLRA